MYDEEKLEHKKLAVQLTIAMLDNHSGDWNDDQTAVAFKKIYDAIRQA